MWDMSLCREGLMKLYCQSMKANLPDGLIYLFNLKDFNCCWGMALSDCNWLHLKRDFSLFYLYIIKPCDEKKYKSIFVNLFCLFFLSENKRKRITLFWFSMEEQPALNSRVIMKCLTIKVLKLGHILSHHNHKFHGTWLVFYVIDSRK